MCKYTFVCDCFLPGVPDYRVLLRGSCTKTRLESQSAAKQHLSKGVSQALNTIGEVLAVFVIPELGVRWGWVIGLTLVCNIFL